MDQLKRVQDLLLQDKQESEVNREDENEEFESHNPLEEIDVPDYQEQIPDREKIQGLRE